MKKERVQAIFELAGIPILRMWELPNAYWPICEQYAKLRAESPWWLIKTPVGLVEIGWRKRVINIDWSDTGIKARVTTDPTTQEAMMVHAWSEEKAIEYLKVLATFMRPELALAEKDL